jgi:hypothetical protein
MPCDPSSLLDDVPKELVEHADEIAKKPVSAESGKDRFAEMRATLR